MKSTKAKPTSATKPAAPAKPATTTKLDASAPTTPAKQPEQKRGTGYYIRRAVIAAFPAEISNEAIDAALVTAGIHNTKKSTISTAKMDCVHTLKVAAELGKLKLSNSVPEHRAAGGTSTVDAPASETPAPQAAAQ
jgi:hypothetical protein